MEKQITKSALCSFISGVLFILSGVFHIYLYRKFTPVYTETKCGDIVATLDDFTVGVQSIDIGLLIEVSCVNPNPYGIEILDTNPGRVFVGRERQWKVGRLAVLKGSSLQEQGKGKVRVHMTAHVSGPEADSMVPHFLEDSEIPVLMELQFNVGVSLSFGLGSWQTSAPFKKNCGMNMAGLLVNQFIRSAEGSRSRLGPLVCRDSFGFQIPPVGEPQETPSDGQMGFSAAQVAPDEVMKGEAAKNLSLGCVITFSFLAGFVLMYGSWKTLNGPSPRGWPPSPSRQPALPPDDQLRNLVGGSDQELEEGAGDARAAPRGLLGAGLLMRAPAIHTLRDISSPEAATFLAGSPIRREASRPSPGLSSIEEPYRDAAERRRATPSPPARLRSESKLGLPQHSPTMLSALAVHSSPASSKSPVKGSREPRAGSKSPIPMVADAATPQREQRNSVSRSPSVGSRRAEAAAERGADELPRFGEMAMAVPSTWAVPTPRADVTTEEKKPDVPVFGGKEPPRFGRVEDTPPLMSRANSVRSKPLGEAGVSTPPMPPPRAGERRHTVAGHLASPSPTRTGRSASRSPLRSSPPYTPPNRSPSPSPSREG